MHKTYRKQNGKTFGPYYYATIRTNDGKTKSIYLGKNRSEALDNQAKLTHVRNEENARKKWKFRIPATVLLVVLLVSLIPGLTTAGYILLTDFPNLTSNGTDVVPPSENITFENITENITPPFLPVMNDTEGELDNLTEHNLTERQMPEENVTISANATEEELNATIGNITSGDGGLNGTADNTTLNLTGNITSGLEGNITSNTNDTNANITIIDEETRQFPAVIGKPVKWVKKLKLSGKTRNFTLELPAEMENISVSGIEAGTGKKKEAGRLKIEEIERPEAHSQTPHTPHGKSFSAQAAGEGKQNDNAKPKQVTVETDEEIDGLEIEYYTPAPESFEEEIGPYKKMITISSETHYEDILAFTNLSVEAPRDSVHLYWLQNDSRTEVPAEKYDTNGNGLADYVEWTVPSLSNQTYEIIIEISKAEELDENRIVVRDVYDYVKAQDNNWTQIQDGHYARVTFKQNLTNQKDIIIYARVVNRTKETNVSAGVEVYEKDDDTIIVRFENISKESYYKVYLTDLQENYSQDVFDLRSVGDVEYDYIVDPEIYQANEQGLVLLMHFNSQSAYGENSTYVYDFSGNGNNGTVINATFNSSGGILGTGAFSFDEVGDYIDAGTDLPSKIGAGNFTFAGWIRYSSLSSTYDIPLWMGYNDHEEGFLVGFRAPDSRVLYASWGSLDGQVTGLTSEDNTWYHVASTYNGTTHSFYVNGIFQGSVEYASSNIQSGHVYFGAEDTGGVPDFDYPFNGSIDEVAIYNRSLNASEILQLYYLGLPNATALTNIWNCSTNQLWSNASCWSLGRVPQAYDDVVINGSGTGNINITNNTLSQNLNSFVVASNYPGKIYFLPLFAVGSWGSWAGTQEWNVWGDINISNGTMYVYGDAYNDTTHPNGRNITYDGRGQVWKSVSGNITIGSQAVIDRKSVV